MPIIQKQSLISQENAIEALLAGNISVDEGLLKDKTSDAPSYDHQNDYQIIIESEESEIAKESEKVTLLIIPTEIRLRIYDILLVSRNSNDENPSWVIGDSDKKLVRLHRMRIRCKTMDVAILRTCRKIYHEAVEMLYSRNAFHVSESDHFFQFTRQIGAVNLKFLRALYIWVPRLAQLGDWLKVMKTVSEEATGLRVLQVGWDAKWKFPWGLEAGNRKGLGDSVEFAQALGRIQGLDRFAIKGYYAKNWPAYLEEKMSVKVQAKFGFYRELKGGKLNEEEMRQNEFSSKLNEKQLKLFEMYQTGTEDIFP